MKKVEGQFNISNLSFVMCQDWYFLNKFWFFFLAILLIYSLKSLYAKNVNED